MIASARKDGPQVTSEWARLQQSIDGVSIREVLHVPRDHGVITEMYRPDWDPSGLPVVHIYQSRLFPGAIGAWSCHSQEVAAGADRQIVLYDGREESPTFKRVMELHVGDARPAFLVLPPGIWHGLQNLGAADALLLNFPSRGYDYEDPDHWRLPYNSPEIPYNWLPATGARLRSDHRLFDD